MRIIMSEINSRTRQRGVVVAGEQLNYIIKFCGCKGKLLKNLMALSSNFVNFIGVQNFEI